MLWGWEEFQVPTKLCRNSFSPVGKGYKHELVQKVRQALDMEKSKVASDSTRVESPIQLDSDSEMEIKPNFECLEAVGSDVFEQPFIHLNDQYINNLASFGYVPTDTFLGTSYSTEKSRWIL